MTSTRIQPLDGLRGIASVAVVLGHANLIYSQNNPGDWIHMPVIRHVLSSVGTWGSTAVWLFFILSGFVLAWSFTKNTEVDYGTYIVRRLTRLYIPVWGAVLFAVVTMIFVSRNVQGLGDWVASHPARIELRHVVF